MSISMADTAGCRDVQHLALHHRGMGSVTTRDRILSVLSLSPGKHFITVEGCSGATVGRSPVDILLDRSQHKSTLCAYEIQSIYLGGYLFISLALLINHFVG